MTDDWTSTLRSIQQTADHIEFAGLLDGAIASGFLARCREPTTPERLAQSALLSPQLLERVIEALRTFGVLRDVDGGRVAVSDLYAPLLVDGLDRRALDRLAAAHARADLFRGLFTAPEASYWTIDGRARVALAANATGDPETEFGRRILLATVTAIPEWEVALSRGGRFLDLGCGVAGAIVSFLAAYPKLTAVGIDLAADVLEVAQAHADAVGVSDRATFLLADAASFHDPDPFEVVFWPQIFYPEASRADTLATAHASLRPGGLFVTVFAPPTQLDDDARRRDFGTGATFEPLLRSMWGVQEHSVQDLREEMDSAGFVDIDVQEATPPILPTMTARRPVDG